MPRRRVLEPSGNDGAVAGGSVLLTADHRRACAGGFIRSASPDEGAVSGGRVVPTGPDKRVIVIGGIPYTAGDRRTGGAASPHPASAAGRTTPLP